MKLRGATEADFFQKNNNEDMNYWQEKGTSELEKAINLQLNENVAKVMMKYF